MLETAIPVTQSHFPSLSSLCRTVRWQASVLDLFARMTVYDAGYGTRLGCVFLENADLRELVVFPALSSSTVFFCFHQGMDLSLLTRIAVAVANTPGMREGLAGGAHEHVWRTNIMRAVLILSFSLFCTLAPPNPP